MWRISIVGSLWKKKNISTAMIRTSEIEQRKFDQLESSTEKCIQSQTRNGNSANHNPARRIQPISAQLEYRRGWWSSSQTPLLIIQILTFVFTLSCFFPHILFIDYYLCLNSTPKVLFLKSPTSYHYIYIFFCPCKRGA